MRVGLFYVFFALLSTQLLVAHSGRSQALDSINVTVELRNENLMKLFKIIEKQTGLMFAYQPEQVSDYKGISLLMATRSVKATLDIVFEGTPLKYRQVNNSVIIFSGEEEKLQLTEGGKLAITVSGKVSDAVGNPIPGANILVKGTTNGTTTDADGRYSLSVTENDAVLVFSFIGYITQEVAVNARSVIDVVLVEDVQSLEEVVVVGYGTQKKTDVTGAIASVSAEQIADRPVTSFTEALAGQMAGVQVQQIDGAPGGSGLIVRVRGTGSISAGSSPLYVIDGYPIEGDISMINPSDIQSIDVLKDASATAIYGSRGGNGVVIVTTKKGVAGKPKIELNIFTARQQVANKVDMMNSEQYTQWFIDGRNNAWVQAGGNADDPNEIRTSSDFKIPVEYRNPGSLPNTNWQDEIFRTAPMQNYQLSVSGGTDHTRYLISGGYIKQDGIIINTDYERYNVRSDVSSRISDRIEIGLNLEASMANSNHVENGKYGPVQLALVVPPTFPVYREDGSYGSPLNGPYDFTPVTDPSPVETAMEIDNMQRNLRTLGKAFFDVKILEGLSFRTSLGGLITQNRSSYYRPSYVNRDSNPAPNTVEASSNTSQETDWLLESLLFYNKAFNDIHSVNAVAGYTRQYNHFESNYVFATNFPNDNIHTLNNGQVTDGDSRQSEFSLISYLARVNYAFKDKYLFTATIRADGSSRFGANNKWGTFPSLSLGWRMSEEEFMQAFRFISDMKIRTSYGFTGNNAISNYGAIGLLGTTRYVIGDNLVNGVYPSTISNPNLGWEMTRQFDLGLEMGILRNRILFEIDYYYRSTKDLLLSVPVPRITGYGTQLQNIGKVRNLGLEFFTTSRNLVGAFKWNTSFNISFNRNKVLALGSDDNPIYASAPNVSNGFITKVGHPIANFFGYINDGVYLSEEQIAASAHHPTTVPGDPIIRDTNGDGVINAADRTIIGNNQPDFFYGINNDFSYKNFDLGIQLVGSQGGEVFSMSSRFTKFFHGARNARADAANRWRSPEEPGDGHYFRANRNFSGLQKEPSNYWVQDASFLRVRNATFGYKLPQKMLDNARMQSFRVYFSIQNLYTFTDYFGFDPEVSTSGSGLTRGGDYTGYPTARTFTLGVNVVF
jgi:TonB-linked SusC/RagA family outer membrane protein